MARIGPTIALTSLTIVASELILTRIFSVVLWYHFAFFAISVALFGLGVAALAVHFFQHRLPEAHTDRHLALGAMGQALALVVVDFALSRFSPDWFGGVFTELTFKLVDLVERGHDLVVQRAARDELGVLIEHPDAGAALHRQPSGIRGQHAREHLQQRALALAVAADEPDAFAGLD